MKSPHLLCRTALLPDEYFLSFLFRTAQANRYEPYTILTAILRQQMAQFGLKDNLEIPKKAVTYELLELLTGVPAISLAKATLHRFAGLHIFPQTDAWVHFSKGESLKLLNLRQLSKEFRPNNQSAFCPMCLQEAPYHHLSWMPHELTACLVHNCQLLSRCASCHSWLHIRDVVRCRCACCGADLRKMHAPSLHRDPFAVFSQSKLQSWWGLAAPPPLDTWGLPDQPIQILHFLFRTLRNFAEEKNAKEFALQFTSRKKSFHAIQVMTFRAFANWPQGLFRFLRAYLDRSPRNGVYPAFCYGYFDIMSSGELLVGFFNNPPSWLDLEFLQQAVDDFLVENYASTPTRYWSKRLLLRSTLEDRFPFVKSEQAAQILGMRVDRVEILAIRGVLRTYDVLAGPFMWLWREDVLKLQQEREGNSVLPGCNRQLHTRPQSQNM